MADGRRAEKALNYGIRTEIRADMAQRVLGMKMFAVEADDSDRFLSRCCKA
jgi:hypothetical protein